MTKTALLASAAAVALSAGNALAASPLAVGHGTPQRVISATPSATLYDQTSNVLGGALGSQNFGGTATLYDDQGADDFTVPAGAKWKIKEVDIPGVNYGSHAASSLNVIFYKDKAGLPGKVASECDNQSSSGYNGSGGYAIKINGATCTGGVGPKLKGGAGGKTYWVSVVANQQFSTDSQWFWSMNGTIHGNDAQWQNPGGGFGICPTWCGTVNVVGYTADFAFTLKGKG